MKAPLPRQVVEDNLQCCPSKVTQFIADCTAIYMAFYRDNEGFYGCYLHDPLAMAVAIDSSLVTTESLHMMVETEGRFTTGMSLADRRDRRDEETNPRVTNLTTGWLPFQVIVLAKYNAVSTSSKMLLVPMILQYSPSSFNWIIFTVIGRIVS